MSIIIYGKNAVRETVAAGRALTLKVNPKQGKDPIVMEARVRKVPVEFAQDADLTRIAKNPSHQGFVAICADFPLFSLDDLIEEGKKKEYPLILILDGIEDPHNLGAIMRSADAFGVDGIVIKKKGEVPLTSTVAKVSTGAINYVKVAQVTNLTVSLKALQKAGYWVVASDGAGKVAYDEIDYRCPIALIVGSEGFGISRLLLENSDFVAQIPMLGHVNSLNASVSAGILLSQIVSFRRK